MKKYINRTNVILTIVLVSGLLFWNSSLAQSEIGPNDDYLGQLRKNQLKWEMVSGDGSRVAPVVTRSKVHGGWLVGPVDSGDGKVRGLTFVPDPQHKWDVKISGTEKRSHKK